MAGTPHVDHHRAMAPALPNRSRIGHAVCLMLSASLFWPALAVSQEQQLIEKEYIVGPDGVQVPVVAGEVIVKTADGVDFAEPPADILRSELQATEVAPIDPSGRYYLVRSNRSTSDMIPATPSASFLNFFSSVEPNVIYETVDVGVSGTGQHWALDRIEAQEAWNHFERADGVLIGVIDTGLYSLDGQVHPDLDAALWRVPTGGMSVTINRASGVQVFDCDAGALGLDVIKGTCAPIDLSIRHGTWISGVIGAAHDNVGIDGVIDGYRNIVEIRAAPNWKEVPAAYAASAIYGLVQLSKNLEASDGPTVRIMTASWGSYGLAAGIEVLETAIKFAADNGILFVAAAGNDRKDIDTNAYYPASFMLPNMINVAATTPTLDGEELWSNSNFGVNTVQIAAPGDSIFTTSELDGYDWTNGTSMAVPFVAGTAALLLACNNKLTPAKLITLLEDGATSLPKLSGLVAGGRRLNAGGSMALCVQ